MNWTLLTWIVLIWVEIFRNWCIIEVGNKRPTYWWSNIIRITVGFMFWIVSPMLARMDYYQWWGMIPMMLFTFWFVFDYGLNLVRNLVYRIEDDHREPLPFYYLNPKGSWLDRLQYKYPHPYPWFWFKLILMVGGLMLFYYGIDFIANGND